MRLVVLPLGLVPISWAAVEHDGDRWCGEGGCTQIRMLSTTSGLGVRGGSWIISSSDVST